MAYVMSPTTLTEIKDLIRCFRELCDAYLVKPIDLEDLRPGNEVLSID